MANCIYCKEEFDPSIGEGDHVIPARLGEFNNDEHFRGVCPSCNTEIGKHEQQLLQSGPERLFREIVVPATSRSRGQRAGWTGAEASPPPKFRIIGDDGTLLARPEPDPKKVNTPDQFVLFDSNGECHHVLLFPTMSDENIRNEVLKKNLDAIPRAILHCDEKDLDAYNQKIAMAFPKSRVESSMLINTGSHQATIEAVFTVNKFYFSAIAKIAFHYFLSHSIRGFSGDEQYFNPIRNFIRFGKGEISDFISLPSNIIENAPPNCVPSWWLHLLAATEDDNEARAYVSLFKGPEIVALEYEVLLGHIPNPSIYYNYSWAHQYEYFRPVPPSGNVGAVRKISV